MGSYLEGSIFEQTFGGNGVSTMHVINYANQNGIRVYTIDQENVDSVMPKLDYDSSKKQEFRNLIMNGKEITVPEKEVTIDGWQGTGYIVENPDNGTAAYMISGGLNGGVITLAGLVILLYVGWLGFALAGLAGVTGFAITYVASVIALVPAVFLTKKTVTTILEGITLAIGISGLAISGPLSAIMGGYLFGFTLHDYFNN